MSRHGNFEHNRTRKLRQGASLYTQGRKTLTGTFVIPDDGPTFWFLNPGTSGRVVQLPPLPASGGMLFFIANTGTSFGVSLNVQTSGGVQVALVGKGETAYFMSSDTGWKAGISSEAAPSTTAKPFFILAMGQSNIAQAPSPGSWSPHPMVNVWNNTLDVDLAAGTAFSAPSNVNARVSEVFGSMIAEQLERPVFVLSIGHGSQPITHWLNAAVTFDAATDRVTWPNFNPRTTDTVRFSGLTGAAGITAGTTYWVKTVVDKDTFTLSLTSGGALVDITSNGSGTGVRIPDAYGTMKANIDLALSAAGCTQIDLFEWWQGENQKFVTEPSAAPLYHTYEADWEAMFTRLKSETWFPSNTPVVIHGLAPASVAGDPVSVANVNQDIVNNILAKIAQNDPDNRMFIAPTSLTGSAGGTYWDVSGLHPTGLGSITYGRQAAREWLAGNQRGFMEPVKKVLRASVIERARFRNLLKAADFGTAPWQRGTSFAGGAGATFFFGDSFLWETVGAGGAAVTITKDTVDIPLQSLTGIKTYASMDVACTTAEAAPAGTVAYKLAQRVLGADMAHLGQGFSGSRGFVWSGYIKSSVAGFFHMGFKNVGNTQVYVAPFVIETAATWQRVVVPVPGSVTGTWNIGNNRGMEWWITLASGFAAFGPSVWNNGVYYNGANQANVLANNTFHFRLALPQLEEGFDPSPFEIMSKEDTLLRCRRTYRKSFLEGVTPATNAGESGSLMIVAGNAAFGHSVDWPDRMANDVQTVTAYNPSNTNNNWRDRTAGVDGSAATIENPSATGFHIRGTGATPGNRMLIHWTSEGEV